MNATTTMYNCAAKQNFTSYEARDLICLIKHRIYHTYLDHLAEIPAQDLSRIVLSL